MIYQQQTAAEAVAAMTTVVLPAVGLSFSFCSVATVEEVDLATVWATTAAALSGFS